MAPPADAATDTKIVGDFRVLITEVLDSGEEVVRRLFRPTEIDVEYVPHEGWRVAGTGCVMSTPEDEE